MVAGLFYLAALSAIVVAIVWAIMNDRVGLFEKTSGILAMKDEHGSNCVEDDSGTVGSRRGGLRGRRRLGGRKQAD